MFTFKPAPKSSTNGNGNGNGHTPNGNGASPSSTSTTNSDSLRSAAQPADTAQLNSAGPAPAPARSQSIANWLGLGGNGSKTGPLRPAQPRPAHHSKVESVIGPGLSLKGTLTGAGNIRIDGTFDGTIDIQGALLITDGAKVTAEVHAGAVSVGGSLKGNVTADKVEILSTGRVWGDLLTTAFATEEGAFLRGQVRMEDQVPPAPLPEPAPEPVPFKQTGPATAGI